MDEDLALVKQYLRKTLLGYAHKTSILMVKRRPKDNDVYDITAICGGCSNNMVIEALIYRRDDRKIYCLRFQFTNSSKEVVWTEDHLSGKVKMDFPDNHDLKCSKFKILL